MGIVGKEKEEKEKEEDKLDKGSHFRFVCSFALFRIICTFPCIFFSLFFFFEKDGIYYIISKNL